MKAHTAFRVLALSLALFSTVSTVAAKDTLPAFQTGFFQWKAGQGGFGSWSLTGLKITDQGELVMDPLSAVWQTDPYEAGSYNGHNFYNGGSYWVGEAISEVLPIAFSVKEAIAAWNATTPSGSWVEVQIRAYFGDRASKWFNLGIWAAGTETIERHSVNLQGDTDGYVAVDTLVITNKKQAATGLQLKVRLFSVDGVATPAIRNASLAYSSEISKKVTLLPGDPALWDRVLNVPECSQMVYPDGGNVWCSPTSVSMVLGYWNIGDADCEKRIRAAVAGVYDWLYDGHGNWPFNTAYAASLGMEAFVVRFDSMADIEPWIAAGVPVVVSFGWGKGELTGSPIPSSSGHLAVVVGFDASGNPIVNDPAAAIDEDVRRTYLREEFETLWLSHSGGTAYLIYPGGWSAPTLP